jgi:hypothetical protein
MSEAVADWISSQPIDLRGRKKVLLAAGVLSRTGDAARHLGGFARYLQRNRGFVQGDFLEVTYRGQLSGDDWTPIPYQAMDSEAPLSESTAQVVRQLRWYDARLPTDLELHMVGYSLGGVVLFRVVVGLLLEDSAPCCQAARSDESCARSAAIQIIAPVSSVTPSYCARPASSC